MIRDFDAWNTTKKGIDSRLTAPYFKEREVWWCAMGLNIGHEQAGKGPDFNRPVVVLKKVNGRTTIIIPLTSLPKTGLHHFDLGTINTKASVAILPQLRLIDSKRLIRKIGTLNPYLFAELKRVVRALVFD